MRNAVERFHRDMERSADGGWLYYLDYDAAERVMLFVEMLPHIKGPEAGRPINLAPWQKWIYLNVFGWKRRDNDKRRFRKIYTEIPRGNGKSTMVAPAALYAMSLDEEGGAEVYSAAVSRDQARIVFNVAQAMARRSKYFCKMAGISVFAHSVSQDRTNSMFQSLAADARSLDGLNVHMAILDELAQHRNREVHDVIETGTGKRKQPIMWMITTAGTDQGGIGFEVHDYAVKLLTDVVQDDSFFAAVYTIDDEDDWADPASWSKANPNWGISVMPETIEQLANRAIQIPSFQNSFRIKHLNQWTTAGVNYIDSAAWSKQAVPVDENDFLGEECVVALDLASKVDIAAKIRIFRRPNTTEVSSKHPYQYIIIPTFYIPEGAVKRVKNANYLGWSVGGHLKVTPGEAIDFEMIEEDLREDYQQFDVVDIPYDPWQATQMAQHLTKEGLPMIEFPATVRNFSEPMKSFEAMIRQGLILHNSNPVMNWMISNLVGKTDHKGNVFPRKNREDQKIDGPVAVIMGMARWLLREEEEEEPKSVYSDPNRKIIM